MWARTLRVGGGQGGNRTPTVERRLIYSQRSSPPAQPTHGRKVSGRDCGLMVDPITLFMSAGADDGTRTRNRRFTKPLLYQLSYVGAARTGSYRRDLGALANDRAACPNGSTAPRDQTRTDVQACARGRLRV